ncbi:hypothetical protein ACRALDRAFT_208226 [Sodiomyces alcalophilus JCM 7366]|uniref:uncharacterized protein n=1 Tax=Sodiomyces alcalophilus JCM 7366 TaxID=591952 RepID=UPI0039B460D2
MPSLFPITQIPTISRDIPAGIKVVSVSPCRGKLGCLQNGQVDSPIAILLNDSLAGLEDLQDHLIYMVMKSHQMLQASCAVIHEATEAFYLNPHSTGACTMRDVATRHLILAFLCLRDDQNESTRCKFTGPGQMLVTYFAVLPRSKRTTHVLGGKKASK